MLVTKALYGLVQLAKLWNDDIAEFMEILGFIKNPMDPCIE